MSAPLKYRGLLADVSYSELRERACTRFGWLDTTLE